MWMGGRGGTACHWISVSVDVGIGRRNPKNWRPESAFPHLWQLFLCSGDLTSRCYIQGRPTPPGAGGQYPAHEQILNTHSNERLADFWRTDNLTFLRIFGPGGKRRKIDEKHNWGAVRRRKERRGQGDLAEVLPSTTCLVTSGELSLLLSSWSLSINYVSDYPLEVNFKPKIRKHLQTVK